MSVGKLIVSLGVAALYLSGCGTWLAVGGATDTSPHPGGIAVNQRALYHVDVGMTCSAATPCSVQGPSKPLSTVDPSRVLVVDWLRMPFSSGELTVQLTAEQTVKEVTLIGTTGAARAAEAATTTIKTIDEIEASNAAE